MDAFDEEKSFPLGNSGMVFTARISDPDAVACGDKAEEEALGIDKVLLFVVVGISISGLEMVVAGVEDDEEGRTKDLIFS